MATALHLLGEPWILRDDGERVVVRGHKAWGLLAYLASRPAGASRSHLAGLLFGDAADPLAALRWNLSELRRALGEDTLRGDPLQLPRDALVLLDVDILREGAWQQGLALPGFGSELLEGQRFPGCASFQVWLDGERQYVAAQTTGMLREAALAHLGNGQPGEAVLLARRLVALNPLDENFQVLLVRCLAVAGDGVAAARQAAACRELFARELGVRPSSALDAALTTATATVTHPAISGRGAVKAQVEAGEAALRAGALDAGLECLRRAIADADAFGETELRKRARVALGGALIHSARGRDEEGAAALHESLALGQIDASDVDASACRELGYVEFLRGRYERALGWLSRAEPLAAQVHGERARIFTVRGAILSDQSRYGAALDQLSLAVEAALQADDLRQRLYADSMVGRVLLLTGEYEAGRSVLDETVRGARQAWTAFLPWPQSLAAEAALLRGQVDQAAEDFEQAFALGCHLGDPCWEGLACRGLALVAQARGAFDMARTVLLDALKRGSRFPDTYRWGQVYVLDALCAVEVSMGCAEAQSHVDQMLEQAQGSGMRELAARAYLHSVGLGQDPAHTVAAHIASEIDNPVLMRLVSRPHAAATLTRAFGTGNGP